MSSGTALAVDIRGLHPGQVAIAASTARWRVVCAGRRWGKTRLSAALLLARALEGGRCWWVAPTAKLARVGWRELRGMTAAVPGVDVRLGESLLTFPGGGSIQVRTAGEPGGLRGDGLDALVYDEAAFGREDSWTHELRPALSDRRGWALFPSTPRGRANWFYRLFQRGQSGDGGDWASWRFPTSTNPYIDAGEIEEARELLPAAVFDQEYRAEFIDAGLAVFNAVDIDAMVDGWTGFSDPAPGGRYVTAWDIGRRGDAAVGVTLDVARLPYTVVAYDRLVRVPYPAQQSEIEERHGRYGGRLLVESNGPGDPVIENLRVRATPFVTTARSKVQAIQALQLLLERGALKCGVPQIEHELRTYEWDDRALVQDSVMTLAIATTACPPPGRRVVTIDAGGGVDRPARRPELAGIRQEAW